MKDRTGSYSTVFLIAGIAYTLGAVFFAIVLFMRKRKKLSKDENDGITMYVSHLNETYEQEEPIKIIQIDQNTNL